MAVDSMAIHDAEEPQALDPCEVLDRHLAVLIGLLHVRNDPLPRLAAVFFNDGILNLRWS